MEYIGKIRSLSGTWGNVATDPVVTIFVWDYTYNSQTTPEVRAEERERKLHMMYCLHPENSAGLSKSFFKPHINRDGVYLLCSKRG